MTYQDALLGLNAAIYKAIRTGNAERRPVSALIEMAADIDHIIDHGMTREEMRSRKIAEVEKLREIVSKLEGSNT